MEGRIYLPETQKLIDQLQKQPTDKQRLGALEAAIADLAILLTEVKSNG